MINELENKTKKLHLDRLRDKEFTQSYTGTLTLENLKKINFLIGPNNSGKSRLLRFLYTSKLDSKVFINGVSSNYFGKTYIPLLRGLRTLHHEDLYLSRTNEDYFFNKGFKADTGTDKSTNIFTGHTLFQELKKVLESEKEDTSVKKYEDFLSDNFFNGLCITLSTPDEYNGKENDVIHLKIGNNKSLPIYDIGDGIQTVILLTLQPFLDDKPRIFFIEEPEQNVHAGLQRSIIKAFRLCPQHIFFMTTHSNHFIDLALDYNDISIQLVENNNGETIVKSTDNYGDLLDSLGVRASSVLLANCSVWVEGVTDKLYLRAYLKKYIQEINEKGMTERAKKLNSYNENLHYVFVEYQGSNITHWAFSDECTHVQTLAKKLNKNILVIADGDIRNKGERVENLTEALGSDLVLLDWKEVENYIPYDILIETAKARWSTFQQRSGCSIERFKNIRRDIFQNPKHGVGQILERYVDKNGTTKRLFYKKKSGTINDKLKFCHTAIDLMNSQDWKLTPELTALCERVWAHIEKHNS